jgi:hypothetical protein
MVDRHRTGLAAALFYAPYNYSLFLQTLETLKRGFFLCCY